MSDRVQSICAEMRLVATRAEGESSLLGESGTIRDLLPMVSQLEEICVQYFRDHGASFAPAELIALKQLVDNEKEENHYLRRALQAEEERLRALLWRLNARETIVSELKAHLVKELAHVMSGSSDGRTFAAIPFELLESLDQEYARVNQTAESKLLKLVGEHENKMRRTKLHYQKLLDAKEKEIIQLQMQFRNSYKEVERRHTTKVKRLTIDQDALQRQLTELDRDAAGRAESFFSIKHAEAIAALEARHDATVAALQNDNDSLRAELDQAKKQVEELDNDLDAERQHRFVAEQIALGAPRTTQPNTQQGDQRSPTTEEKVRAAASRRESIRSLYEAQIRALRLELSQHDNQLRDAQDQYQAMSDLHDKQLAELQKDLEVAKVAADSQSSEEVKRLLHERQTQLRARILVLETSLHDAKHVLAGREEELQATKEKLWKTQDALELKSKDRHEVGDKLTAQERSYAELQQRYEVASRQIVDLQRQITHLHAQERRRRSSISPYQQRRSDKVAVEVVEDGVSIPTAATAGVPIVSTDDAMRSSSNKKQVLDKAVQCAVSLLSSSGRPSSAKAARTKEATFEERHVNAMLRCELFQLRVRLQDAETRLRVVSGDVQSPPKRKSEVMLGLLPSVMELSAIPISDHDEVAAQNADMSDELQRRREQLEGIMSFISEAELRKATRADATVEQRKVDSADGFSSHYRTSAHNDSVTPPVVRASPYTTPFVQGEGGRAESVQAFVARETTQAALRIILPMSGAMPPQSYLRQERTAREALRSSIAKAVASLPAEVASQPSAVLSPRPLSTTARLHPQRPKSTSTPRQSDEEGLVEQLRTKVENVSDPLNYFSLTQQFPRPSPRPAFARAHHKVLHGVCLLTKSAAQRREVDEKELAINEVPTVRLVSFSQRAP